MAKKKIKVIGITVPQLDALRDKLIKPQRLVVEMNSIFDEISDVMIDHGLMDDLQQIIDKYPYGNHLIENLPSKIYQGRGYEE
jgi:hypothetical protein